MMELMNKVRVANGMKPLEESKKAADGDAPAAGQQETIEEASKN